MVRRTVNLPFADSFTAVAGANGESTTDLLAIGLADLGLVTRPGMTIVRLRGHCYLENVAASGKQRIGVALMLSQAGGLTVEPDIRDEVINAIWRLDAVTLGNVVESASGVFTTVLDPYVIESKGMRKISRANEELKVFTTNTAGSNVIVHVVGTARVMLE